MLAMLGLWKWIAIAIAVAAVVGAFWLAKSKYDAVEQRKGYDRAVAEYQPKVDRAIAERDVHLANLNQAMHVNVELVAVNKQTVALYAEQEAALTSATDHAQAAQEQATRAKAVVAERTKGHDARIVELLRRAREPLIVGENICEEADRIARATLRGRLRDGAGTVATTDRDQNRSGKGPGPVPDPVPSRR